ncbi:PorP/SprF family type IX secretion system membrane protein [Robertkochia solimangrovi]|uniref:PorP/SprF family type IX secretion system membrane protein n=1 Tax=Robertkochia solimangrovi TaxID=2213046 RepID=UPI00117C87EB|nr:type IX secretion system membrane protein PorP/SprF [Robertkochia solimangrovi]TRZ42000.1 hypothetical protein DMZ48_15295 [Robertkochia solimangrovi]
MKNFSFRYSLLIIALITGLNSYAQQDPSFTMYMYNMSLINPGYATDDPDFINFGAMYRNQWVGAEGGPTTMSVFVHSPLTYNVEGGLSIVHDQIGDVVKETNVYADAAYVISLNRWSRLSFGVKVGATFYNTDFDGFVYSDPLPDPAYASNVSKTFPNFGFGAFFFSDRYYVGLSAPQLLRSKHLESDEGVMALGREEIHFFLTGGYVFPLSDSVKFKPTFMTRAVGGAPLSVDLNANVMIEDKVEVGLGYRFGDSMTGLVNFKVTPGLRVGYAYDYTVSNLGRFNSGTHEIMLLWDLNIFGLGNDKSPRFF